jgi:hypothetical protein
MDEQTTRAQEAARQSQQEAARRSQPSSQQQQQQQQRARESANDATRVAGQLASLGTETLGVWADVSQHAMRNMLELTSHSTQESARQLTELQRVNVDMFREMQAAMFRWNTTWPEMFRDPIRWYQHSLEESIEATQRLFEIGRRNAESKMQGYQRLESATQDTTKTIAEAFREAATKMQDVYARSDRLRAA